MSEIAILQVCPHCGLIFETPSLCVKSGESTVPSPVMVTNQMFRRLANAT